MQVTIYDVARQAGVSVATVSRVLNGSSAVKEATRRRVLRSIEALGYQPNLLASALITKKTFTLGLLVPDIRNPFFSEVARAVEDAAARLGYQVMMCNTDEDEQKAARYVGLFQQKGVDGIIVATARSEDKTVVELAEAGHSLVLIARDVPAAPCSAVVVDDFRGGYLATRHLLRLGHRSVAMLTEPLRLQDSRDRLAGYRQAMEEGGLGEQVKVVEASGSTVRAGEAAFALLLEPSPPTAVFACNDPLALGVVRAARAAGLSVPRHLSVVGFDGTLLAEVCDPPLATVVQPIEEMGRTAVELLHARLIGEGKTPRKVVLQPELRPGASAIATG